MNKAKDAGSYRLISPDHLKKRGRKFWQIDKNIYSRGAGIKFVNKALLTKFSGLVILGPPPGTRGFPDYPEAPIILIDKKLGKPPRDLELFGCYWLVSAKAKNLFESLDHQAFSFCKCETRFPDGTEGPEYWLCDVLPMLDAVDEENSIMNIIIGKNGGKSYSFVGNLDVKIREDIVSNHKIFRLLYHWSVVICDNSFKTACKELKNVGFYPLNQ